MGYVFISYSSENKDFADAIKKLLNKNSINTWMAPDDIPAGSKYPVAINNSIKQCSCFLLLLTNIAQESPWIAKEVERAISCKKIIVPVQLEDVILNDEFQLYISTNQIMSLTKIDDFSEEVQTLISDLKTYVNTEGKPTPETVQSSAAKAPVPADTGSIPALSLDLKIGSTIAGKYTVLRNICDGNIFKEYLAVCNLTNKDWLLKVICKQLDQEQKHEREVLRQLPLIKTLDHPGIPRVIDVVDTDKHLILVTEYWEGYSLLYSVQNHGALPEESVVDIALAMADIVSYLHSRAILLGNALHPENIMLAPNARISLISLLSLRWINDAKTVPLVPSVNHSHDAKETDIYLFGMLLYHIATGLDPRNYQYEMQPVRNINPKLSKGLEAIISKCVAKKPQKRYKSIEDVINDIDCFFGKEASLKLPTAAIKMRKLFKKK